jgi:hypothetical protein
MRLRLLSPLLVLLGAAPALAADLRVYPTEVAISGPNRTQQLLVVLEENGRVVADLTATAKFTPSDPKVATVSPAGLVTAAGAGETTVTATADGRSATL